jgi:hypothetical protein
LLLGSLADGTPSEHKDKAGSGLLIVNVAGPIGVDKTIESGAVKHTAPKNEVKI